MSKTRKDFFRRVLIGFATYIFIGTFLLMLPIANVNGEFRSITDSLFHATSAVTTTGLSIFPMSEYTFFGQLVMLVLIQVGGLGYMTIGAFVAFNIFGSGNKEHKSVVTNSFSNVLHANPQEFLRYVIVFSLIIEVIVAAALLPPMLEQTSGVWLTAIWAAIFHSVSAFCTAGFSTFDAGTMLFANSIYTQLVFIFSMLAGGLGFIVGFDLWYLVTKRTSQLSFTTKVILIVLSCIIIGASLYSMLIDPNLSFLHSLFTSVSAITSAGFTVVNLNFINPAWAIMIILLMSIGAAPSSTSGGMKVTTLTGTFAGIKSYIRGEDYGSMFGRILPKYTTRKTIATFVAYSSFLVIFFVAFTALQPTFSFQESLFEVSSALGTAGLSMGITPFLATSGKIILTFAMFVGRVGVLTILIYILFKPRAKNTKMEDISF